MNEQNAGPNTILKHHAILSPSSSERWLDNCPGSIRLSQQCPPGRTSKYATEGIVAHALAAAILTNNLAEIKKHELGNTVDDVYIDEDMYEAVMVYVNFVRNEMTTHKLKPNQISFERKVKLIGLDYDGSPRSGTVDAMLHIPFIKLQVTDFKYGRGLKVSADDNPQLLDYLLGSFYELPPLARDDLQYLEMVIVQPRFGGIERVIVSVEELLDYEKRLLAGIERTKDPDAILNAGSWCKFCPAAALPGLCPAIAQKDLEQINEFQIDEPSTALRPYELSGEALATAIEIGQELQERVKIRLNQLEGYAQGLLENGQEVPRFKLVKRRTNRAWIDVDAAEKELVKALKNNAYATAKVISPAQAEKFKFKVEGLVHNPDKGYTIAPTTDSRPAEIAPNVVDLLAYSIEKLKSD